MDNFSLYWTVDGVSWSRDFATRRNVKKRVLFPRYQGSLGGSEAPCAYVGSTDIDPSSNLSIINLEDSIPENSRAAFSGVVHWQGKTGYSSARYFLLTDVVGNYITDDPEPFYWKHVLSDASIDPDSVAVIDSNLGDVAEDSFRVVREDARDATDAVVSGSYESCSVFSNYKSSYDEDTGELEIYFVRYKASGSTHYQILNSQSAFTEAVLDDVSTVTGQLKPWRKVYIVSPGTTYFTVTTPQSSVDYFLVAESTARIALNEPVDSSDDVPWFLNVSDGSFVALRDDSSGTGVNSYTYSVPEFESQDFSPIKPYKASVEEVATWIRSDILKVIRTPLQVDADFYIMDVLVKNTQGSVLYALTTDTARDGTSYLEAGDRVWRDIETDNAWVDWDAEGISGWDQESGFIQLQREFPDKYHFFVSYYYRATGYELTSLNLNPIFDETYNGQFYVVYIVPTGGNNANVGSQATSVHYIKVDRSGKVVETSQDGLGGNYNLSEVLEVGGEALLYSRSATMTTVGDVAVNGASFTVNASDLEDDSEEIDFPARGVLLVGDNVNETVGDLTSFLIEYTSWARQEGDTSLVDIFTGIHTQAVLEGTTLRLFSFKDIFSSDATNDMQWLILAETRIKSSMKIDDLSVIDLRQPGGVLKKKYYFDATKIDPRAVWARPSVIQSRGQPIPGDSAAVIKVPYTLLTDYGGSFTEESIEAIVAKRHLATGVVPVIVYHGAIPQITSLVSTTDSIAICWDSEGDAYSYNIYRASLRKGPWTLVTTASVSDQVYGNCYTLIGLESGLIYYFAIAAVDSDGLEGPKGTVWGIKTRTTL